MPQRAWFSAAWAETRAANGLAAVPREHWLTPALFAAVAAGVAGVARLHGAYELRVWVPLGLVLVSTAAALIVGGRRPSPAIVAAASALLALGMWSVASTAWGGLPHQAWLTLDQSILWAAALLTGSLLTSSPGRRGLIASAVLVGLTIHAGEVITRLALAAHPAEWLHGRFLQGPVGYHNAQAVLLALGVPLALWLTDHRRLSVRVIGGLSGTVLVAALLLTQSRGALLALAVGVAAQLAWARQGSLLVPTLALAAAFAGLAFALRDVDAALLEGTSAEQLEAFRYYALWTVVAAAGVAVATVSARSRTARMVAALGLVVLVVGGIVAAGLQSGQAVPGSNLTLPALPADEESPDIAPAGETRIPSLSPNGRRDAWRVASLMVSESPVIGAGQGQFAPRWTEERRLSNLYMLQPHSLELELASELGIVGVALFGVFVGGAALALVRTSRRGVAAAALGAGVILLVEASLDWTWSFPGIVAPLLLVVGAAAGSRELRPPGPLATGAALVAAVAFLLALAAPYLADSHVKRAGAQAATATADAREELEAAQRLHPWNAEAIALEGQIAEDAGELTVAATHYRAAAELSQRPWLDHFREARALAAAGERDAAFAACMRAVAANPGELSLYEGPCYYEVAGNRWPVVETVPRPGHERGERAFSAFLVDEGCDECSLSFSGSELLASVPGGADSRDTAYAVLDLRRTTGGPLVLRDTVRLPAEQRPADHLAVLQVRDTDGELIYELYVSRRDSTIALYSPPGGLQATELNRTTGVRIEAGAEAHQVEIRSLPDDSVSVRVDGVERLAVTGLSGATTARPRLIRVGLVARSGTATFEPVKVAHSGLVARFASVRAATREDR